jgi:regulatory protein
MEVALVERQQMRGGRPQREPWTGQGEVLALATTVTTDPPRQDATAKVVTLLASRERTRLELTRALRSKGYSEAECEAAIARVVELGYLDDGRVAAQRAAHLLSAGKSRSEVVRRLSAQGIEPPLAIDAVRRQAEASGQDDEAVARALVSARHLEGPKAARFLAGRGFDETLIRRLLGLDDD